MDRLDYWAYAKHPSLVFGASFTLKLREKLAPFAKRYKTFAKIVDC